VLRKPWPGNKPEEQGLLKGITGTLSPWILGVGKNHIQDYQLLKNFVPLKLFVTGILQI